MLDARKITEIDLDFVKNYLRIDHDEDDILLNTMIVAAQNFIQSYLNKRFSDYEEIPDEFSIACLALIAHWYENREIQSASVTKQELAFVFSGLLDLHRDWNKEEVVDAT